MYVASESETSDNTEATRFSQCAHDQRRRLEAEDCNSIRCAQLISGGRRRIRPCPPHCLAHARPTMCCIRLVMQGQENMYGGLRTRTAVLEHIRGSFARSGVHWPINPRVIVTLTLLKVGCNLWGYIKQPLKVIDTSLIGFHDG